MQGMVVANVLRGRKNKEQLDHLDHYISNESPSSAAFRTRKIQGIIQNKLDNTTVALDNVSKKAIKHEKQVDGMLAIVEERLDRGGHYTHLLGITLFFVLYMTVLFLQRDATQSYSVEASFLDTLIRALPENKYITSDAEFYEWLDKDIVERIFQDPACGDGVCAIPDEFPGFGRFGCQRDCGRYTKTSTITVNLQPYLNYTEDWADMTDPTNTWWDLEGKVVQSGAYPGYKFNVYSHTMGEFLLAEDAAPADDPIVIEVPDGPLTLHLYQTTMMSGLISANDIYKYTYIDGATLPDRNASTDFAYGDKREAVAAQAILQKQIIESCFSGQKELTTEELINCLTNPTLDYYFKGMAAYGLQGDVKTANGSKATSVLQDVSFCKIFPRGFEGLLNETNKNLALEVAIPCSEGVRRRRALQSARRFVNPMAKHSRDEKPLVMRGGQHDNHESNQEDGGPERRLLGGGGPGRRLLATCTTHDDCDQNVFDKYTGNPGQFCTKYGQCDSCSFCQVDKEDSIDGVCPLAYCPMSGGFPECLDASKLLAEWSCPDSFDFQVYKYSSPGKPVVVKPPPKDAIRRVTPFNRLVGAVVIEQERRSVGECRKIKNADVKAFASDMKCLKKKKKGKEEVAYGRDPVLMSTSSIYDGKLSAEQFYLVPERARTVVQVAGP